MQESKCKYCGGDIGRAVPGSEDSPSIQPSPWIHADLRLNATHKPEPVESNTLVGLHNQITDLLMVCFIPQSAEFDAASNNLVRRGISSVTQDIMRLVEDHYEVKQ